MLIIKQTQYVRKDDYKCLTTIEEAFPTHSDLEVRAAFSAKVLENISLYDLKYTKMSDDAYLFADETYTTKVELINKEENAED